MLGLRRKGSCIFSTLFLQDGERQEENTSKAQVTEKIKSLPNGLKKRLISNLLLNAVLDKAMQDILPDDDIAQSGVEETDYPHQVTEEQVAEVKQPLTLSKKKSRNVRKGGKGKKSEDISKENGLLAADVREIKKTETETIEKDKDVDKPWNFCSTQERSYVSISKDVKDENSQDILKIKAY